MFVFLYFNRIPYEQSRALPLIRRSSGDPDTTRAFPDHIDDESGLLCFIHVPSFLAGWRAAECVGHRGVVRLSVLRRAQQILRAGKKTLQMFFWNSSGISSYGPHWLPRSLWLGLVPCVCSGVYNLYRGFSLRLQRVTHTHTHTYTCRLSTPSCRRFRVCGNLCVCYVHVFNHLSFNL